MKERLKIVRIDANYCDYLRVFEDKVPFVGVLFTIDNCMYFAPLASPKPKHLKLKNKLDFLKLKDGLLGAINFNNMLPVTSKNIIELDLNKIGLNADENKYLKLLKEQLFWLNRHQQMLYKKSYNLYNKYISGTLNGKIAKRCCNFKLLEEKCLLYNRNK